MRLTEAAKEQLKKKTLNTKKAMALTIGYDHCGCAGMQLSISVQKIKPKGSPQIRETIDGFTVIYDLATKAMVENAVIDFDKRLFNYGFHITNNASSLIG